MSLSEERTEEFYRSHIGRLTHEIGYPSRMVMVMAVLPRGLSAAATPRTVCHFNYRYYDIEVKMERTVIADWLHEPYMVWL